MKKPNSLNNLKRSLNAYAKAEGLLFSRVNRHVGYNAILGVVQRAHSEGVIPMFLLKGGVAIELRLGLRARASKDVDLGFLAAPADLLPLMQTVLALTWDDFSFEIKSHEVTPFETVRLVVKVYYLRKPWDTVKIDITAADEMMVAEFLPSFELGAVALPTPSHIPCLSVLDQVAQKIHAVTDPAAKDRFRDLVDIMLHEPLIFGRWQDLRAICVRVFAERKRHAWPPFREFPPEWIANVDELLHGIGETRDAREAIGILWKIVTFADQGVTENVNREYRFVLAVISSPFNLGSNDVPSMKAATDDGFRLVSATLGNGQPYTGTFVFAVFEKERVERIRPRLHMRLKTNGDPSNLMLVGWMKNTSTAIANQVSLRIAGSEPMKYGSMANGDAQIDVSRRIDPTALSRGLAGVVVQYRDDYGTRFEQAGVIRGENGTYIMDGLQPPVEIPQLAHPYDGTSDV